MSEHRETADVVESGMSDQTINVRLPAELLELAEEMIPLLQEDDQLRLAGRISRSSVIRLAVFRGMQELRKAYDPRKKGKAKK